MWFAGAITKDLSLGSQLISSFPLFSFISSHFFHVLYSQFSPGLGDRGHQSWEGLLIRARTSLLEGDRRTSISL